jgi:hypothetical protein
MWMSISGTTLCLFVRFPTTADLIKEQTFVITCDARGRTSSFPFLSCGEEERFRFSPDALAGSCRSLGRYVVGSTLGPVLYSAPVSRILGGCYATGCFPDVVGIYPRKIGSTTSGALGFRESAFRRHGYPEPVVPSR